MSYRSDSLYSVDNRTPKGPIAIPKADDPTEENATPGTRPIDEWGAGRDLRWGTSKWPALQNSHDSMDAHETRMNRLRWILFPGGGPFPEWGVALFELLDDWLWARLHEPRIVSDPFFLDIRSEIIGLAGACDVSETVMELLA